MKKLKNNNRSQKLCSNQDFQKLTKIKRDYESGKLLSGEIKAILIEKINEFLAEHQKRRKKAKSQINKFLYKIQIKSFIYLKKVLLKKRG